MHPRAVPSYGYPIGDPDAGEARLPTARLVATSGATPMRTHHSGSIRRPVGRLTVVWVALALMIPGISSSGASQELPFRVTIVDWDRELLKRQRDAYRSEAAQREVLFCVEAWTTGAPANGIERIVITRVRRELAGQKHHIDDMGAPCLAQDGKPLPMFHTHSEGN